MVVLPTASVWHKCSSSFGGELTPRYLYYFHRNNLIYVRKRIRGAGKWRVCAAVLRRQLHYVWQLYRRRRPEAGSHGRAVGRAIFDFALGRWGEGR